MKKCEQNETKTQQVNIYYLTYFINIIFSICLYAIHLKDTKALSALNII